MLLRKAKLTWFPAKRPTEGGSSVWPKTGPRKNSKFKIQNSKFLWIWLFPIAGLLSLIWFLIRVVPKPSRATYPCQRVAAPLASGFVVWLAGLIGSTLAYRRAKRLVHQSRYVLAGICVVASIMAIWWSVNITAEAPAEAAFIPSDPPNSPIGVAKGIYPGRVVWVHDPGATSWDGATSDWWDDNSTDQDAVDYMVSKSIQTLTGEPNDVAAWDALFRHFNQVKGFGDVGYQQGEKIAIKINMNQDRTAATWGKGAGMPSPHVIYSVLNRLINVVGVPGSAITIYDAARFIGDPIYNKVRSNPDPNFQAVTFVVDPDRAGRGRIAATRDLNNPIHFGNPSVQNNRNVNIPLCVTQAKYLINMALLRPHTRGGVTLCAKNHFGSVYFPSSGDWTPAPLHNYMGRDIGLNIYNCLVDLIGHGRLGAKTMLYMIDGLYPARTQETTVIKWESFGDDWCSSIFVSQDPVAIDSVGLDFLRNEPRATDVTGNPDNYMHEAALADNPPSRTFYDPEGDGTRLESMGVHEHWNNPVQKKYSRNLGTGNGIELVTPSFTSQDGPVENVTSGKRYDYIRHAISDANQGDEIIVGPAVYYENINFSGKNLKVSSINPNDPNIVSATVIHGSNRAVTFSSGEDANCVLAGLSITGAKTGLYCSGASPTIINCKIAANQDSGVKLSSESNPTLVNCIISGNGKAGIELWTDRTGRFPRYSYATITNCTIVGNFQHGILEGKPTVTNSIIYNNGAAQIVSSYATVTYCNVQGAWPGTGNINADPLFVVPGYWDQNNTPADFNDDFWVEGDYHLRPDSPCVNAGDPIATFQVIKTDIDGQPRIMAGRVDIGCDEVP